MLDAPSNSPSVPGPERQRLLLVDDNTEGRRALTRLLEFYNFDVTAVGDGQEALRVLASVPPPDVVLTDYLLPDLDGREVARQAHALDPQPVVVLITGWDFGQEPPDCVQWGIDHIVLKPVNVANLVSKIATPILDSDNPQERGLPPHPRHSPASIA